MKRRGVQFNKGALIGVPVALLFFLGILYQDELPQVPAWILIAGWLAVAAVVVAEGAGECVVVYGAGREVDAEEMPAFIREATMVASMFCPRS